MMGFANEANKTLIGVAHWPEFKKPILTVQRGNSVTKIASFNSEEAVQMFFDALHDVLHTDKVDWMNTVGGALEGRVTYEEAKGYERGVEE